MAVDYRCLTLHGCYIYFYNAIWSAIVGKELQCANIYGAKKLGIQRTGMQFLSYIQGSDVNESHCHLAAFLHIKL